MKGESEKAAISYKEQSQSNSRFAKVDTYFETAWNDPVLSEIKIEGLDIDTVFNNFIRQVAGNRLNTLNSKATDQHKNQASSSTEDYNDDEKHDIKTKSNG